MSFRDYHVWSLEQDRLERERVEREGDSAEIVQLLVILKRLRRPSGENPC